MLYDFPWLSFKKLIHWSFVRWHSRLRGQVQAAALGQHQALVPEMFWMKIQWNPWEILPSGYLT